MTDPRLACLEPWRLPVPTRAGQFAPVSPDMAAYNVEVDLGAMGPYGATTEIPDPATTLYCDLQRNVDINPGRRLGGGRSGFFRDSYLKGVGRTILAGNWGDPGDAGHATGHHAASDAAREYLVSGFLEACDRGDTIIRCHSLLARPLPEPLAALQSDVRDTDAIPADLHLAALTAKEGGFARHSNITWLLDQVAGGGGGWHFGHVFRGLVRFSAENTSRLPRPEDVTPKLVVDAIETGIDRGIANFRRYLEVGLLWVSLHNNFGLDGRFLDLEVPVVLGHPIAGEMESGPNRIPVGFEVIHFLRQTGQWLGALRHRLDFALRRLVHGGPEAAPLATQVVEEIDARFPPGHILHDPSRQAALVRRWLEELCDLGPEAAQSIERLAAYFVRHGRAPDSARPSLRQADIEFDRSAPRRLMLYTGRGFGSAGDLSVARAFVDAVAQVDAATSVDDYLARAEHGRAVAEQCGRAAMGE